MTRGETPIAAASREAPRTNVSAPPTSKMRPRTKKRKVEKVIETIRIVKSEKQKVKSGFTSNPTFYFSPLTFYLL
jgi:hypothetical protein